MSKAKVAKSNADLDRKIAMYKALRTVKDKIDKGQLGLFDPEDRLLVSEQGFVCARVIGAILLAEQDPDLADIKRRLDQQVPIGARVL